MNPISLAAGPSLLWFKVGAVALVAASLVMVGERWGSGRVQARWDAEKAAATRQALEASQEARRIEQARAAKVQEVQDDYATRAHRDRAAADSAGAELGRLRDALGAAQGAAATAAAAAGDPDGAARARAVVGSCAGALVEMAAIADSCESRLSGLQGYVRTITGAASASAP